MTVAARSAIVGPKVENPPSLYIYRRYDPPGAGDAPIPKWRAEFPGPIRLDADGHSCANWKPIRDGTWSKKLSTDAFENSPLLLHSKGKGNCQIGAGSKP